MIMIHERLLLLQNDIIWTEIFRRFDGATNKTTVRYHDRLSSTSATISFNLGGSTADQMKLRSIITVEACREDHRKHVNEFYPSNEMMMDDETTTEAKERLGRDMYYADEIAMLQWDNEWNVGGGASSDV